MKNVKRKGSAGERELAEILRREGIRAYRNDQIYRGGKGNPDVFAETASLRLHVEVKRQEKLNVPEAVNQAINDAAEGFIPLVAHRRNREKWLVTMPLCEFIRIMKDGGLIDNEP